VDQRSERQGPIARFGLLPFIARKQQTIFMIAAATC